MASTPDQTAEISTGTLVDDRYELGPRLGQGGFATVFKARHIHIQKEVAIKILEFPLHEESKEGQEHLDRFRREAQAATIVTHPNVVQVHDFGFTGKPPKPYLVMELLDGRDLDVELLHRGGLAPGRGLRLFRDALAGLAEAHQHGIIHRDLKPANLFLDRPNTADERLRILDFGIAGLAPRTLKDGQDVRESKLTQKGQIFGTPAYLPPEFVREQITTPSFDVYQMGLILVEILSGRPVVGEDLPYDCMEAHVQGRLDIPDEILSTPLGPVIRKALATDYTRRYSDATEFLEAFDEVDLGLVAALLTGEAPDLPLDSRSMWSRAMPVIALLVVASAAALVYLLLQSQLDPDQSTGVVSGKGQATEAEVGTSAAGGENQGTNGDEAAPGDGEQGTSADENAEPEPVRPETVVVAVNTTPPGAQILLGKQKLGQSPAEVELEKGSAVDLTLTLDGYKPATLNVNPGVDSELTHELQPDAETIAARKKAAAEKAEAERLARKKAEAERLAKEEAEREAREEARERRARRRAEERKRKEAEEKKKRKVLILP